MWMSVIPPLPLLALSLLLEGPQVGPALAGAFTRAALPANLGLLYIVVCSSVIGFGIWNTLMTRHPASVVAPDERCSVPTNRPPASQGSASE